MSEKTINIGRILENNIVIKHEKVSSKHCKIKQISENQFLLEDLDSSNGTFVNDKRIKQTLITETDKIKLATFEINTTLVLSIFSQNTIQNSLLYENLLKQQDEIIKQQQIFVEFAKLKDVYENYQKAKKKTIRGNTLKSTGLRAGLSLIPLVGIALGTLSQNVTGNVQEKIMELTEQFKKDYICPSCFKFLGDEPFENMEKRGTCLYCKTKWIKE